MRNLIAFLLVTSLLVFSSCRKDDITDTDPTFTPDPPTVTVESSFFGLVKDEEGQVIANATVFTEANELLTDENGYFIEEKAALSQKGSLVKVIKEGYYDAFRFVMPAAGNSTYVEITMIKKVSKGEGESDKPLIIDLTNGTKLTFSANSIANEDGTAYNGNYEVFAHYYNPTDENFAQVIPGDQRGLNRQGEEVQLVSYGMMAVEIYSSTGEKLNLLEGSSATWEVAVDPTLTVLPDEMPLWSLDEQTGIWLEEGVAVLENGKYIGEPTHFSFWNYDVPFPLVEISGVVVDENDVPLPRVSVCILTTDGLLGGYGSTDNEGRYRGLVPKGEDLNMSLTRECNEARDFQLGIFSSDTDLQTLQLSQSSMESSFSGIFLNCEGIPVENGYVSISLNEKVLQVVPLEETGIFSDILMACEQGEYSFQGIDLDGLTQSEKFVFEFNQLESVIELDEISACDTLDEYWIVTIDGDKKVGTEYELTYNDLEDDLYSFEVKTPEGLTFWTSRDSLVSVNISYNGNSAYCDILHEACIDVVNFDLDITPSLTEDYCMGKITGELEFTDGAIRQVDIEFRLKVDQRTVTLSLDNFLDVNKNGIKDPGERKVTISAVHQSKSYSTGTFSVRMPLNQPSEIKFLLNHLYRMTEQDVGSDDSIDSDFNLDGTLVIPSLTKSLTVDAGFIWTGLPSEVFFLVRPKYCEEGSGCVSAGFPGALHRKYELDVYDTFGTVIYESGLVEDYHTICDLDTGAYEAVITVSGEEVWFENFTVVRDEISLLKSMELNCIGDEVEANMSVSIINADGDFLSNLFAPEWKNETDMIVQTEPEYIAGPGRYTFTASYQACSDSIQFVVPEDLFMISGTVWDDNTGIIPNEGEGIELGVGGVEIVLIDVLTGEEQTTTTQANGIYSFEVGEVTAENFILRIDVPTGYELVEKDVNPLTATSSSAADPLTAETDEYSRNCSGIFVHFGLK